MPRALTEWLSVFYFLQRTCFFFKNFFTYNFIIKMSFCNSTMHWSQGLLSSMNNPDEKVYEDNLIVIIRDKYPKAWNHFLVLPKKDINTLNEVTREDLPLISHMDIMANFYVNLYHKEHEFIIGYHAVPSMLRLHLHVISTDFNSPCLKTKHHWNTFTTPFFIYSKDACQQLEKYGKININAEYYNKFLNRDLKCHKCEYTPKTMFQLKKHLLSHL